MGLAGIFAAGAAPAIVTEPMKIWVPKEPKVGVELTDIWPPMDREDLARALHKLHQNGTYGKFAYPEPTLQRSLSSKHLFCEKGLRQSEFGEAFYPTVVAVPQNFRFLENFDGPKRDFLDRWVKEARKRDNPNGRVVLGDRSVVSADADRVYLFAVKGPHRPEN